MTVCSGRSVGSPQSGLVCGAGKRMAGRQSSKHRAVFLDRDGTMTRAVHHPRWKEQVQLLPGSARAVRALRAAGWLVIMVTNQSVVGRGYISEKELHKIHDHLQAQLRGEGCCIDAIYYCPHHPEAGQGAYLRECPCRKPAPGMLLQAATDHQLALHECVLVGDSLSDIEAGQAAGCTTILVRTGYGEEALRFGAQPDAVVDDLYEAAQWIVRHSAVAKKECCTPITRLPRQSTRALMPPP